MSVLTKQQRIAELAERKPDVPITSLNHYVDEIWLEEAWQRQNKHSAAGVDRLSVEEYAKKWLGKRSELIGLMKTGRYRAPAVRRTYIPKSETEKRPLGIPTIEDKVVQKSVQMLLEPIYENEFLDCSYGFRAERSAHQAVEKIWRTAMNMNGCWVIDVDISKYFDNVDHKYLREFLKLRMNDGVISRLIGKWLKAGIWDKGQVVFPKKGTPQGGVISPLLANIYLHYVLDDWFYKVVKPRLHDKAELVRYADDFVILVKDKRDVDRIWNVLPKRLEKYGLKMNRDKSKIVDFQQPHRRAGEKGETFDFLGFTHHWGVSRKGRPTVIRKTSRKSVRKGLRKFHDWLKENRHMKVILQHEKLHQKLVGYYGYYKIRGNSRSVSTFKYKVQRLWHYWLNRRNRNNGMSWKKFNMLLQQYPLPEPSIVQLSLANL